MMSIACDARALVGPQTGVGTWTEQIIGGLVRAGDWRAVLAASRAIDLPPGLEHERIEVLPPPRLRIPGTLWLNSLLRSALTSAGIQVWIASLAVVPRRCPVPAVAMVHDLTPRTHPHRHTLANRFCFNAYAEESFARAAAVVVGSRATEEVVRDTFPWLRHRLHFISYGVDRFFAPATNGDDERTDIQRRYSQQRPYLLHLGTLEPRKGLQTLVRAWERLHQLVDSPPELVLAGTPGWGVGPLQQSIERSPHRRQIHLPGYVSRSDARSLLRHAEVFVLPSEAEGFGLPLAEAISCGTPCVASDIPPLREVAAGAAMMVPVGDSQALADTLCRVLEPAAADRLRRLALDRAPDLRWQPVVSAWQELLTDIISDHPG